MDKNLFLIGFMGAGKSTVAARLSKKLNMKLVEMDARIVEEQGMSINDIFEQYGEAHFRDIESRLILDIGAEGGTVVSCGGGVVVRPENTEYMKKNGIVVFLSAMPETIYERVKDGTDRPILNGHMNVAYIAELMDKRKPLYEAAADYKVATDGMGIDEIVKTIMRIITDTE